MEFGPTGYAFEIDSYDPANNVAGAPVALMRITEFGGINEEGITTDLTALADVIENEGFIGRSRFDRIALKGYIQLAPGGVTGSAADGAFKRIGRPTRRDDYPNRTFKVTHKTGFTQSIEVSGVVRNKPITSTDDDVMFEAELAIGARQLSDIAEEGL